MELGKYSDEPIVNPLTDEMPPKVIRWYETRYTEMSGTQEDYEQWVEAKLASHAAKTLEMGDRIKEVLNGDRSNQCRH